MTTEPGASATADARGETIEIKGTEGTVISVDLPPPSPLLVPSAFSFAIHKSGSVLLDNVMVDLCRSVGIQALGMDNICFARGLRMAHIVPASGISLLSKPGYFFYGFRGFHEFMWTLDLSPNRKIILVRDPRDILTSYFFSMARSHGVPDSGKVREIVLGQRNAATSLTIDDYVLSNNVRFILTNFRRFMSLEGPNTKIFRYEDIIFDKRNWVSAINDWFGLDASPRSIAAIATRHDIIPTKEDPDSHIRQVTPGNHRKHLAPATIAEIGSRYKEVMDHYGYRA